MAQHVQLKAERRELLGKKVRRLRATGILPATIYGQQFKPLSVQVNARDFQHVLKGSGRTQLIDLVVDGDRPRPVFVKNLAVDAKRNAIQHIEFYQANLRVLMQSSVPVHTTGESQAVRDGGILLSVLDHVTVESLPDDVPVGLDADISKLEEINSALHAGDLPLPPNVTLVTAPDEVLYKVDPPVAEEVVEAAVADTEPLPTELGGEEAPPDSVPEA